MGSQSTLTPSLREKLVHCQSFMDALTYNNKTKAKGGDHSGSCQMLLAHSMGHQPSLFEPQHPHLQNGDKDSSSLLGQRELGASRHHNRDILNGDHEPQQAQYGQINV